MSSELKPCPFCGQYPESPVDATRILGVWRIFHRGCSSLPNTVLEAHSRESVIGYWNRRAPSPAVKALVEACRNCWFDDEKSPERAIKDALAAVEREIGGT